MHEKHANDILGLAAIEIVDVQDDAIDRAQAVGLRPVWLLVAEQVAQSFEIRSCER